MDADYSHSIPFSLLYLHSSFTKKPYTEKAEAEKQRYEREKAAYVSFLLLFTDTSTLKG